jgi:aerobic-type carbon monoxide dehydrogenase small subunit (CoxS/CutS family)
MQYPLTFRLNGLPVETMAKATDTLLDLLREKLGVVSPKRGCDTGECGTCTVILNGEPVRSCLTIALTVGGKKVETLEGLTEDGKMHPLQEAFHEHYAAQCGFCTPGMVMSAVDLVGRNPGASDAEIRAWLEGNLCRCTGYHNIVDAVKAASKSAGR